MPVEIDGFAVLGAIAARPDQFQLLRAEATKTAKTFLAKVLKDRTLTADILTSTAKAIGFEAFNLMVDGLSDADVKGVLAKVDKSNDAIKTAPGPDQRQHLSALAQGAVKPVVEAPKIKPAAKSPRAVAAPKPALERSGNSKAMKAKNKVKSG